MDEYSSVLETVENSKGRSLSQVTALLKLMRKNSIREPAVAVKWGKLALKSSLGDEKWNVYEQARARADSIVAWSRENLLSHCTCLMISSQVLASPPLLQTS